MNRIDRISAILIQLQSKPVVKAQEIADRFDISLRTVYRDIRALEEAGIPIGSEAGVGYFLTEGFHLPPVMFTKKEAGSLLLAEKLVEKMTDQSIDEQFKSAMFKIKSVLNTADKQYLENLESFIHISHFSRKNQPDFPNNFIADLQNAVANKRIIRIEYLSLSKNEITSREIEPIGIFYYGSNWHLIGYCMLRKDYRDFRIDRIKSLTDTGQNITQQKKKSLNEYFELLSNKEKLEKVIVQFKNSTAKYIESQKYYFGFVDQKEAGNYYEMSFLITPLEYIGKWLLSFGNNVKVIYPKELKILLKQYVLELYKFYHNESDNKSENKKDMKLINN